jgi:hypothetical protein
MNHIRYTLYSGRKCLVIRTHFSGWFRIVKFLTPEQLQKWDTEVSEAKEFLGHKLHAQRNKRPHHRSARRRVATSLKSDFFSGKGSSFASLQERIIFSAMLPFLA